MKIYLINLDRATERLAWFMQQTDAMRLDVVRIGAVDAARLDEAELESWRARSSGRKSLSPPEIGCMLSHRKVWQLIVQGADEWAFVAEDDICLAPDAPLFLRDADWIPEGAEVVKAETFRSELEMSFAVWGRPHGHELRRLKSRHFGTAGYFISRNVATRLLAYTANHCEPIDLILFTTEHGLLDQLNVLQLSPAICVQHMVVARGMVAAGSELASQIDAVRTDFHRNDPRSARIYGVPRIWREIKRIGQHIAAPIRRALLIARRESVFKKVPVMLEGGDRTAPDTALAHGRTENAVSL